jgi:hypothetical protein
MRVLSLPLAALALGACTSAGQPPSPAAHAVQNDCPPSEDCHAEWSSCHCTLDARGAVATFEADIDGDGRPNFRHTYVYDDAGALLRWEHDMGADGIDPMICVFDPPCPPPHPNAACSCIAAQ